MPEKKNNSRKEGRIYSGLWLAAEEGIAAKRAADHSLCLQLGTEREGGQLSVRDPSPWHGATHTLGGPSIVN